MFTYWNTCCWWTPPLHIMDNLKSLSVHDHTWHCNTARNAAAHDASIPYGCQSVSFLRKAAQDGPSVWVPVNHKGDLDEATGIVVSIWGVKQQTEALSLSSKTNKSSIFIKKNKDLDLLFWDRIPFKAHWATLLPPWHLFTSSLCNERGI